jgi:prepilin-type N-terminal cleavage/methylation domain-containing protein
VSTWRLRRARIGFTLIEVIVVSVIMAILAATTAPYFVGFLDRQRAQTTADKLAALGNGIAAFASAVHTGAGTNTAYPGSLSELANVIVVGSAVTHRSCGTTIATLATFNATAVASWNASGPFVTFMVGTGGLQTPLGIVSDSLVRSPNGPAVGQLWIKMSVDTADARNLDLIVDGNDGAAAGTVEWDVVGAMADLRYIVPVAARC